MQYLRIIINALFTIAIIMASVGAIFLANPAYPVWAFIASVFATVLGILGALINFISPSYHSEQELEKLMMDYQESLKELDEKKELYLKLVEDFSGYKTK